MDGQLVLPAAEFRLREHSSLGDCGIRSAGVFKGSAPVGMEILRDLVALGTPSLDDVTGFLRFSVNTRGIFK